MTSQQLVKQILSDYPQARNNDKYLILRVWYAQGIPLTKEIVDIILNRGLAPETITRIRRKLRETGQIQGSENVESHRFKKYIDVRDASVHTVEDLTQALEV